MKTNIGVFFGGNSVEHEVAVISALQAIQNIDKNLYEITPIYIAKNGKMYSGEVLLEINNFKLSLLEFTLETGRTHQIRVHSKYINHPLLGDTLYGNSSTLITRQALHAYKVSFIHPITKNILTFEISLPDDINKIIK